MVETAGVEVIQDTTALHQKQGRLVLAAGPKVLGCLISSPRFRPASPESDQKAQGSFDAGQGGGCHLVGALAAPLQHLMQTGRVCAQRGVTLLNRP